MVLDPRRLMDGPYDPLEDVLDELGCVPASLGPIGQRVVVAGQAEGIVVLGGAGGFGERRMRMRLVHRVCRTASVLRMNGWTAPGRFPGDGRRGEHRALLLVHSFQGADGTAAAGHFDGSIAVESGPGGALQPAALDPSRAAEAIDAVHGSEGAHDRVPSGPVKVVTTAGDAVLHFTASAFQLLVDDDGGVVHFVHSPSGILKKKTTTDQT